MTRTGVADRGPKVPRKIVLFDELRELGIPYTRVHLARLEKARKFPKRVRLGGGNRVGWFEDEIAAYHDGMAAARDRPKAA